MREGDDVMESRAETAQFQLHLKAYTLQRVLSATGTSEGQELLNKNPEILKTLIDLARDDCLEIAKDATLALVNVSADEGGAKVLLLISESSKADPNISSTYNLIHICMSYIMDKNCPLADPCCMILSNMTRPTSLVSRIVALIEQTDFSWDAIVAAFTAIKYNTVGANLHYLGPVFSNLSQSADFRRYLMDKELCVIQRLLPFTEYKDSIVRRGGIIGTLKNCCFDTDNHTWLLSPEIDILPHFLLPLAGPEEFDDEDNNKLPLDLQFLPETKQRESDPDIRIMLLEALGQLCATKEGRRILREKNTYVILREFHKWEQDKAALLACENVVDILIKTEEEIGLDNIKDVEVPTDWTQKFIKMDQDYLKEDEENKG